MNHQEPLISCHISKISQSFNEYIDFLCHFSIFGAANKPIIAETLMVKKCPYNFKVFTNQVRKSRENQFLTEKMVNNTSFYPKHTTIPVKKLTL